MSLSITALGVQNTGENLTTTAIIPPTANGLIFNEVAIDFHTINGVVEAGYLLDSVVNAYDDKGCLTLQIQPKSRN